MLMKLIGFYDTYVFNWANRQFIAEFLTRAYSILPGKPFHIYYNKDSCFPMIMRPVL